MKGLLRRLAARAAGTAVPVRSDVKLPFGGGDPGFGEAAESELVRRPPAAAGRQDDVRDAPVADAPPTMGIAAQDARSDTPWPLVEVAVRAPARSARSPVHAPAVEQGPDATALHGSGSDTLSVDPQRGLPQPLWAPIPSSYASQAALPALEARRVEATPPATQEPPTRRLSEREPAPLLPRADRDAAAAPASRPDAARAWPLPMPAAPAPAPAEVHIHIGRIDIAATHDTAPAPRRRTAGAPAPLSLDAYLARRSGT
ncbi:MAG: hypothetical protein JSR59_05260 [Proteobacteria bacterium]|nr:hypothetical protein [Pseudomonadota bacterium]